MVWCSLPNCLAILVRDVRPHVTQNAPSFLASFFFFFFLPRNEERKEKRKKERSGVSLFPVDGHVSIVSLLYDRRAAAIRETAFSPPSSSTSRCSTTRSMVVVIHPALVANANDRGRTAGRRHTSLSSPSSSFSFSFRCPCARSSLMRRREEAVALIFSFPD